MTIRIATHVGPFTFYRTPRRHHGFFYSLLWLCFMPMIWLGQLCFYLLKFLVIGMIALSVWLFHEIPTGYRTYRSRQRSRPPLGDGTDFDPERDYHHYSDQ